ncbi:MAG: sigma-70 family RNA polymerase sigma factor [Coriobacteriia bacterium]|nr:sigma-70 family RNA polymerase sigma factor [Coriobacteriia bacterium]
MWQELFALAYRYLRGRGLAHADAEDIAQDTLLTTFKHLDGIEPGRLRAWVCTVARNKHIDLARRRALTTSADLELEVADADDDPCAAALRAEGQDEARRLLSVLPPGDRRLLELKYVEDRGVAEIAEMLGRPVNSIKVALFRARSRARARFARERV